MAIARLKLDDQFSGAAGKVGDSITRLKDGMRLTAQENGRFTDEMGKTVNGLKMIPDKANMASSGAGGLSDMLGKLTGTSAGAMGSLEGMSGAIGGGLAAIDPYSMAIKAFEIEVMALVTVVVAASAALVGMMGKAIEMADATDQITNTMQALTGDGDAAVAMISKLSAALPFAKSKIKEWAVALASGGLEGDKLEASIKAVAAAAAIMGESGGAAAQNMLKMLVQDNAASTTLIKGLQEGSKKAQVQMAAMGLQTKDLAAALGMTEEQFKKSKISADQMGDAIRNALAKKGAASLDDMSKDLDTTITKLKEGISSAFSGLNKDIDPFLFAVKDLAKAFFAGGEGAGAMKSIVHGILIPSFKIATMAVKGLVVVVNTLINWFLRAAIAFNRFKQTAVGAAIIKGILVAVAAAAIVLGVVILLIGGVIAGAVGLMVMMFAAIPIAIGLVVAAFAALVAGVTWLNGVLGNFVGSAWAMLSGWAAGAVDAAGNFISGLAGGIASGAGIVYDAIKTLASGAIGTLKSALGIASPSKVMIGMGKFTGAGMAEGLKQSQGNVSAAAGGMGGAAASGAASGASGGKGGGKGATINVAPGAIVINGAGSSGEALTLTESALALLLERVALSRGLVTP
jgi:hypothetical protein